MIINSNQNCTSFSDLSNFFPTASAAVILCLFFSLYFYFHQRQSNLLNRKMRFPVCLCIQQSAKVAVNRRNCGAVGSPTVGLAVGDGEKDPEGAFGSREKRVIEFAVFMRKKACCRADSSKRVKAVDFQLITVLFVHFFRRKNSFFCYQAGII